MEPIEYLRGLRRRWKVVAACVLVALGAGFVVTGGDEGTAEAPTRTFEASTYLLPTTSSVSVRGGGTMQTAAARVTLSEIPRRVADAINYDGDPEDLAANVTAAPDEETGLLKISARAPSAYRARLIADAFAEELLLVLRAGTLADIRALEVSIEDLERRIARREAREAEEAPAEDTTPDDPRLDEDRATTEAQDSDEANLLALQSQLSNLVATTTGHPAGFDIIEPAVAEEVTPEPSGGLEAPESRSIRLLIAAILGLLLGVVIALLLERLDTRIRSKDAAEESYHLPVLAEIPSIPRRRRRSVVAGLFPRAPASNAFRLLAAALQFGRHEVAARPAAAGTGTPTAPGAAGRNAPETILVTSAVPGEGKSTVVSNLAATFAEVGKRVVVLSCDFQHPTLHRTFGINRGPGLAEVLEGDGAVDLESALQDTQVQRVRVASTGFAPEKTAALLGSDRMRQLLAKARDVADIVLIDTAPVLAAGDWTQLLPEVDSVLLVARAGKTDASTADRTAETLAILQAPVVGVALNDVPRGSVRRTKYSYRTRWSRRHDEKSAPTVSADAPPSSEARGSDQRWAAPEAEPAIPSGGVTRGRERTTAGAKGSTPADAKPAEAKPAEAKTVVGSVSDRRPKSETAKPEREGATKDGGIPHLVRPSSKE